jgi:Fe-S cluster biogenesis protein NfuA
MKEKVDKVLDKIRPSLMADGGNVELVVGIERLLKQELPEIQEVVAV